MQRLSYTKKMFFPQTKEKDIYCFILDFMHTLDKMLYIMALMCICLKYVGRALRNVLKYLILYAQFSISGFLVQ